MLHKPPLGGNSQPQFVKQRVWAAHQAPQPLRLPPEEEAPRQLALKKGTAVLEAHRLSEEWPSKGSPAGTHLPKGPAHQTRTSRARASRAELRAPASHLWASWWVSW